MFFHRWKLGDGRPRLILRTGSYVKFHIGSAVTCFNFSLATRATVVAGVRPFGTVKGQIITKFPQSVSSDWLRAARFGIRVLVDFPKRPDRLWDPQSLQFSGYREPLLSI
jgi:hypothetical protein